MYFVSKKPESIWLTGVFEHYVYGSANVDGYLVIYAKDIFDAGEWDVFCKLKLKLCNKLCSNCGVAMPVATSVLDSNLWIVATGHFKRNTRFLPYAIKIDLVTKEIKYYTPSRSYLNDYAMHICMKCHGLQINLNNYDGRQCYTVQPNRVQSKTRWSRRWSQVEDSGYQPLWKQYYFLIDETENICHFHQFQRFVGINSIDKAGIDFKLFSYFQYIEDYYGRTWSSTDCSITNLTPEMDLQKAVYFRNHKNELLFISYFKCENCTKLYYYKVEIDFEDKSASLILQHKFVFNNEFPDFQDSLIYTAPNIIVFQISDTVVPMVSRTLTLSEAAYLGAQKIPEPFKLHQTKSFSKKLESRFLQIILRKPKHKYNVWMSLNCLYNFVGIPKSVSIRHEYKNILFFN